MEIKSLIIDSEGGLVDRRIFADREIFTSWNASGYSRVAGFILAMNARFPVQGISSRAIWAKNRSSCAATCTASLRAHLNLCRHRGNRVCRADRGNTKVVYLLLSRLVLHQRRQACRGAHDRFVQRLESGKSGD